MKPAVHWGHVSEGLSRTLFFAKWADSPPTRCGTEIGNETCTGHRHPFCFRDGHQWYFSAKKWIRGVQPHVTGPSSQSLLAENTPTPCGLTPCSSSNLVGRQVSLLFFSFFSFTTDETAEIDDWKRQMRSMEHEHWAWLLPIGRSRELVLLDLFYLVLLVSSSFFNFFPTLPVIYTFAILYLYLFIFILPRFQWTLKRSLSNFNNSLPPR